MDVHWNRNYFYKINSKKNNRRTYMKMQFAVVIKLYVNLSLLLLSMFLDSVKNYFLRQKINFLKSP